LPIAILRRVWFSSRKLRLPIARGALVLEVGSGDSPCPRSDVLFDMSLEGNERVGGKTVHDRPLVLGQAECLPFKDKAFDYVIAFHVLEHSRDPEKFLSELQRVARAGYIETPSLWGEHVQPLTMHRLEVGVEAGSGGQQQLIIRKKSAAAPDPVLAEQFRPVIERRLGLPRLHPEAWVTRYFWKEEIRYRIVNPEEPIRWETPAADTIKNENPRSFARRVVMALLRVLAPKRKVDLGSLLRCPDCSGGPLDLGETELRCAGCRARFAVSQGVPVLFPHPEPARFKTQR